MLIFVDILSVHASRLEFIEFFALNNVVSNTSPPPATASGFQAVNTKPNMNLTKINSVDTEEPPTPVSDDRDFLIQSIEIDFDFRPIQRV